MWINLSYGVSLVGNIQFTHDAAFIDGDSQVQSRFGHTLLIRPGQYTTTNGQTTTEHVDGYLYIGIPNYSSDGLLENGAVSQIRLSPGKGPYADSSNVLYTQNSPNVADSEEDDDGFGYALAAGRFGGSETAENFKWDLIIAAPREQLSGDDNAGVVHNLYPELSDPEPFVLIHQDIDGISESVEAFDLFGFALVTGDFNGDNADDLAIGVPGESIGGDVAAGAVNIVMGDSQFNMNLARIELSANNQQLFSQDTPSIPSGANPGEQFGYSLATGDFNGDGIDDLAIGAPSDQVGGERAGSLHVLRGVETGVPNVNQNGLTNVASQIFNQDSGSIAGGSEEGDRFAYSLAACDFDNDGNDDLAIGVPGERLNDQDMAGAVNILYGTASDQAGNGGGLSDARNIMIHQDTAGIAGLVEQGDEFGKALACGDLNADDFADLVIGIPNEDIGDLENSGLVGIVYGSDSGLDLSTYDDFDMSFLDEPGVVSAHTRFGAALTIGDADLDGKNDLLISSVVLNAAGPPDSVMVLFQDPDLIRRQNFEPRY
ncbi:FG-GAP repeat protein [Marinicella sediminis]